MASRHLSHQWRFIDTCRIWAHNPYIMSLHVKYYTKAPIALQSNRGIACCSCWGKAMTAYKTTERFNGHMLLNHICKLKLSSRGRHGRERGCSLLRATQQGKMERKRCRGSLKIEHMDNDKPWTGVTMQKVTNHNCRSFALVVLTHHQNKGSTGVIHHLQQVGEAQEWEKCRLCALKLKWNPIQPISTKPTWLFSKQCRKMINSNEFIYRAL